MSAGSVIERYASAIHSKNLASEVRTTASDSDVLGAAGLAAKDAPVALALERLLKGGDDRAVEDLVSLLAEEVWQQAQADESTPKPKRLRRAHAQMLAQAVLAWFRDGTCKPCGGHGYAIIGSLGTSRAVVSDKECPACKGTKKVLFEPQFTARELPYAFWLRDRIDAQACIAGPAMMRKLVKEML